MFVQYNSSDKSKIISVFCGPQDAEAYPYQDEVEENDPRYLDFLARQNPPIDPIAAATGERDRLLALAAIRIAPLQDAVDLDEATTADVALLKLWKQYRVTVNRVDLTQFSPTWPPQP